MTEIDILEIVNDIAKYVQSGNDRPTMPIVLSLYHCHLCGKRMYRDSTKRHIKSWCSETEKQARLTKVTTI